MRQEFRALTLLVALSRVLAAHADHIVDDPDRRTSQKAPAFAVTKLVVISALGGSRESLAEAVIQALERMLRSQEHVRKGRSFPRRSLKPATKWCPSGRRGS